MGTNSLRRGASGRGVGALLGLVLMNSCGEVVQIAPEPSPLDGQCLSCVLYRVDMTITQERFTFLTLASQTLDSSGESYGPAGTSGSAPPEPRAAFYQELRALRGRLRLLWEGETVEDFELNEERLTAMTGGGMYALFHDAPDGTRVELHAYVRPTCTVTPKASATRAEVEAFEGVVPSTASSRSP